MWTELCDYYSRGSLDTEDIHALYGVPTIHQNLNYNHQMHSELDSVLSWSGNRDIEHVTQISNNTSPP